MKEIKALIVDDESNARSALKGLLEACFDQVNVLGEAKDLPEAIRIIHATKPDVVFLDIEMPGYSGLDILSFFNAEDVKFKIVFVTAYSEFAIQAFELSAIDYLLKPVRRDQMERVLQKLESTQAPQLDALRSNLYKEAERKIALHVGNDVHIVQLKDLSYLKAQRQYTEIGLATGEKLITSKNLMEYMLLEKMGPFHRISRSFIINLLHVKKILKQSGHVVLMECGESISINADKKNELLERINFEKL